MRILFDSLPGQRKQYFYVIDVIRGLAALTVVIFHYQHFYFAPGSTQALSQVQRSAEPLYWLLWPAYDYGQWAVQLFWGISGFVFANVYGGEYITAKQFWIRRMARLYPLHLITLFVITILQITAINTLGQFLIVDNTDVKHFTLHLFFASFWGFQEGHSFNGPIWSVSVEIISYALFWLTLPWLFRWGLIIPIIIVMMARMALLVHFDNPGIVYIIQCTVYFFMGCGINHFVYAMKDKPVWIYVSALILIIGFIVAGPVFMMHSALVVPVAIAACLLGAVSVEFFGAGRIARQVQFLGASSYGIYLWHLPIQIFILLCLDIFIGNRYVINQIWFLVSFLIIALMAGCVSFVFIERPLSSMILRGSGRDLSNNNLS